MRMRGGPLYRLHTTRAVVPLASLLVGVVLGCSSPYNKGAYVRFVSPSRYAISLNTSDANANGYANQLSTIHDYIVAHALVPAECAKGVNVYSASDAQGGATVGLFLCAE